MHAVQGLASGAAVQPDAKAWRLADLHRVATGRGVTVAVIDSRIEVTHPDLAGQFVANQDFVTWVGQGEVSNVYPTAGIGTENPKFATEPNSFATVSSP